jgi:uncharacterized protein (DUF1501 family)
MRSSAHPSRFSRRRFLGFATAAGGVVVLRLTARSFLAGGETPGPVTPTPPAGVGLRGGTDDAGLILVVVQLDGGNDGLNTVVPYDDATYLSLRGSGAVAGAELSVLDSSFGLASMPYLATQWASGSLAIVHGVGVDGGSLSHFEATDTWERASLDLNTSTGWLGRALERVDGGAGDPLLGMSIGGSSNTMLAQNWSPFTVPADGVVPWSEEFVAQNPGLTEALDAELAKSSDGSSLADQVKASQAMVQDIGRRIDQGASASGAAGQRQGGRDRLSGYLSLVADVINAGLPTRAFHVRHGGFDTHANQQGTHPRLLAELDEAFAAFHERLGDNRDRVVIMTWSEFGRRPRFNGSGTDHGTAAPALVLGSTVRGGHHGEAPPLDALDRNGNLRVTTDFRDYLSGVASSCLGVDPTVIAEGSSPLELLA